MPRWLRSLLIAAAVALAAMPAAASATLLLYPLWSWIEATYGIESVGHSGPADWCYLLVYAVALAALLLAWRFIARRGRAARDGT